MTAVGTQASGYRWLILLVCLVSCGMYYFSRESIPPLITKIQSVFSVSAGTAGLLVSAIVIPGVLMAIPAGFLINKYGFRLMGSLAMVCVALGSLVIVLSTNFISMLCGGVIMGLSSCFLTIGTAAIIPHWFKSRELGFAMGIYSIVYPLSTIIAFTVGPLMREFISWQSPFYLSIIGATLCGIFFFVLVKDRGLIIKSNVSSKSTAEEIVKNTAAWKVGLLWLFYSMASGAFVTWSPTLLSTFKDFNILGASSISSLYMVSTLLFIPVYGWISDKSGHRKPIMVAGLLGMASSILALIYLNDLPLIFIILLVGAFASAVPALAFASMAETMPPEKSGLGFGMMSFWNRTATVVVAPLVGFLLDTTQSIHTFACIALFAVLSATLALTLRKKPKPASSI
ncbi:MAG: MFS transporter [Candidatus Bathyarchaeota archaeon]|nr:MFS transporter [Candidatus Bathyarchaeota archaeon]